MHLIIRQHIIFLFLLVFSSSQNILAENKEDSLLLCIKKAKEDTLKVNLYNELSWLINTQNPSEAKKYGKLSIELATKLNYDYGLAEALNKMGIYEKTTGNYDQALECYNKSLELSKKLKDSLAICMLYNNMGNVYKSKGDYAMAIEYQIRALKLNEKMKQLEGQADGLLNIGLIYDDLNNKAMALDYLQKSLLLARKINDKKRISRALMNIANLYTEGEDKNIKKALELYNQALMLDTETGDKRGQSMCLTNIGALYFDQGDLEKAEEHYLKSLKIKEETGDRKGKAIINENLAYVEQKKNNYKMANHFFSVALEIADSIGDANLKIGLLSSMADNYFLLKDYKSAGETYQMLTLLKDSIFNKEMSLQLTEMQTRYETEKKEKDISLLQKDKQLQRTEIKKQQLLRNTFIIAFVLVFILVLGVYRSYTQKKKANLLLAAQKKVIEEKNVELNQRNEEITAQRDEIETQRDEIEAQRDEIEAQRDLVTIQKERIEEIYKEVTDSINYAKKIQEAILPVSENARSILGDHFVLFKPKDIVSGDFYFVSKINQWLLVAVADCTGHGVPGAFMSMLGISFLNDIVRKQEVTKASQVLDELRREVIHSLRQKGVSGEQKDGMDISLLVINKDTNECQWAGANNPLYIIKKFDDLKMNQFESDKSSSNLQISQLANQFIEIKGDKMPIAIYPEMKEFTNHEFVLQKGDIVYLFTDGYADQFGGPKGRKFMYKQFKEMLVKNSDKPMSDQQEILETFFENWKSGYEQVDDITLMGMKI